MVQDLSGQGVYGHRGWTGVRWVYTEVTYRRGQGHKLLFLPRFFGRTRHRAAAAAAGAGWEGLTLLHPAAGLSSVAAS